MVRENGREQYKALKEGECADTVRGGVQKKQTLETREAATLI